MKRIYISGKIGGVPIDRAKAKFKALADYIRNQGHRPYNPFDNGVADDAGWEAHMKGDIAMLLECDECWMLPCWKDSRGATIERDLAKTLGIPVRYEY